MSEIMDGKQLAEKIKQQLAQKVADKNIKAKLAVIMCGDDDASKVYVKLKSKACKEVGIEYEEYIIEVDEADDDEENKNTKEDIVVESKNVNNCEVISKKSANTNQMTKVAINRKTKKEKIELECEAQRKLIELIEKLNDDESVNGILLQYPLPESIDYYSVAEHISPLKDVDGFNPINVGWLNIGKPKFIPCTPLGIMKLLEEYNVELDGKKVVIIGRSNVVGKPLTQLLLQKNCSVTICHSKTLDLKAETLNADIIIAAAGKQNLLTVDMVKQGCIVIDVGTNRDENGKLCGDVEFDNVKEKALMITPSPGGVGPMTIAMLMQNTIKAYELQTNQQNKNQQ